jgi:hypothetical protein
VQNNAASPSAVYTDAVIDSAAPLTHSVARTRCTFDADSQCTSGQSACSGFASRGLSSATSDMSDSPWGACSPSSFCSESSVPRWSCTGQGAMQPGGCLLGASTKATTQANTVAASLFDVRVHKHRNRHIENHAGLASGLPPAHCACVLDAPALRERHLTASTHQRATELPTPFRRSTAPRGATESREAAGLTADDYYCRYLARYRSQSSFSLPARESTLARHDDRAEHTSASSQPAKAVASHLHSPSMPTPGCSPIPVVQGMDDGGCAREGCDLPGIVCRLFASISSEEEEIR